MQRGAAFGGLARQGPCRGAPTRAASLQCAVIESHTHTHTLSLCLPACLSVLSSSLSLSLTCGRAQALSKTRADVWVSITGNEAAVGGGERLQQLVPPAHRRSLRIYPQKCCHSKHKTTHDAVSFSGSTLHALCVCARASVHSRYASTPRKG